MTGIEMQSDRSAPTSTDPATLPSSQHTCPLMKLPTEVRFMIYAIALQQTIDHAISPPFGTPRLMPAPACKQKWSRDPTRIRHTFPRSTVKYPPLVGALALLHTSRQLRSESAQEFNRLGHAHTKALGARDRDLHNDLLDLKSGKAQLSMPRFSRLPLFKGVRERWVHLAIEHREAHLDVRMARQMFWFIRLICHITTGTRVSRLSTPELRRQVGILRGLLMNFHPRSQQGSPVQ